MKSLTVSVYLLALTALFVGLLSVGFLGSYLLDARIQRMEEAEFQALLPTVATLIEATQWQAPWDSDPAWLKLERQLNLDLLPVPNPTDKLAANAAPSQIQRSSSVRGTERLIAVVQLQGTVPSERLALQVTREVRQHGAGRVWWISWGLLCLVASSVLAVAMATGRAQQLQLHGLLEPWLRALRGTPQLSKLLPQIETKSELVPALGMVTESVNQLVSELHSENRRSELVLGNLQEGVLAVDDCSHVLLANQALHQLLGLAPEPFGDRLLLELIRLPQVNEVAARVLKERTTCEALVDLPRPSRTLRIIGRPLALGILPVETVSVDVRSTKHERFGAILTIHDETMLHRMEAIRRDFVANASHELKTPLAAIRAYAETLQLGALDDRSVAEQFIANIIEQSDRMHGLVQGMLQLSRVESGTALKFERFDPLKAAQPCIAAAKVVALSKGIQIEISMPNQPLEIRCDRDSFQTILSNLLSNAVRYTHDGGPIRVDMHHDGHQFLMRVTDTGIGIAPVDLERIFERFYRAEKDRSTQSGGTGLGLSIVKHLAQALGGIVQATSQPGEGSCFEIRLPVEGR